MVTPDPGGRPLLDRAHTALDTLLHEVRDIRVQLMPLELIAGRLGATVTEVRGWEEATSPPTLEQLVRYVARLRRRVVLLDGADRFVELPVIQGLAGEPPARLRTRRLLLGMMLYRRRKCVAQDVMAEAVQIDVHTLRRWESCIEEPTLLHVIAQCLFLGLRLSHIPTDPPGIPRQRGRAV